MYIKKIIVVIACILLLAGGFMAGAMIGYPNVDSEQLKGDISKAKAFKDIDNTEIEAAKELLASDTTYQNQMAISAMIISSRIAEMDSMVLATVKATEGIKELEDLNKAMVVMSKRTANARNTYNAFLAEADKVVKGEKSADYEQASNNAMVAYTMLENSLNDGPQIVGLLMQYLEKNNDAELSKVTGQWMYYCASDAVLGGDKEDIAYWKKIYDVASANEKLGVFRKIVFSKIPSSEIILTRAANGVILVTKSSPLIGERLTGMLSSIKQLEPKPGEQKKVIINNIQSNNVVRNIASEAKYFRNSSINHIVNNLVVIDEKLRNGKPGAEIKIIIRNFCKDYGFGCNSTNVFGKIGVVEERC